MLKHFIFNNSSSIFFFLYQVFVNMFRIERKNLIYLKKSTILAEFINLTYYNKNKLFLFENNTVNDICESLMNL